MPRFDKSLDAELFSQGLELERTKLTVAVYAYNKGQPKIQITRQNKTANGEFTFTRLGRISKEEIAALWPLLETAKTFLKD